MKIKNLILYMIKETMISHHSRPKLSFFFESKLLCVFILSFLCCFSSLSQSLTQSEIPIVIITTSQEIPDEPKIEGSMKIISNDENELNLITDAPTEYDGNIAVEKRGNSTQLYFDKKSYSLELKTADGEDNPQNIFGMGADEDWILHAMVIDKTQLRVPLSFHLSQEMGHYASEYKFVELIVNDDYKGLYILTEKIKRDDDRLNIAKLTTDMDSGDELTGGYILKLDRFESDEDLFFLSDFSSLGGMPLQLKFYYPKPENITDNQKNYIQETMNTFEEALFSSNYENSNGVRYTELMDVQSFADFILINELTKNSDGYRLSSFIHKDRNTEDSLLRAGPIWDFDQTLGLSTICSGHRIDGWLYLLNQEACHHEDKMPLWWQTMMSDPVFQNYLACRWQQLRTGIFHESYLLNWIDIHTEKLKNPLERNFTKWDYLGTQIWETPLPTAQSYSEEIQNLKDWILNRLFWMDQNIPGNGDLNTLDPNTNCTTENNLKLNLFPNPSSGIIYFYSHPENIYQISVFNSTGELIQRFDHQNNNGSIYLKLHKKGMYFIRIESTHYSQVEKVILE